MLDLGIYIIIAALVGAKLLLVIIHGSCMSYRDRFLDLDPTYKDAYGLPLLRMTFDWHENEKKMLKWVSEKCVDIAKAMKPAHYHAAAIPTKYSIVPYQSTRNLGGAR